MKEKKKKRGGKRAGAGRKPSGRQNEAVTVYTDVSKFGGRAGTRIAIYEFLDGTISKTGESKFMPIDLPYPEKKFPPSDEAIKAKGVKKSPKDRVDISGLTQPTDVLKPQEQPKTNLSISAKPKTLDELKRLCPAELTGLDRSEWVRTERQKYGI